MTGQVHYRRRESDRADERSGRAAQLGDYAAYVIATAQAEAARRRRAEWEARQTGELSPPSAVTRQR
jgi:hypothetical protein